MEDDDDDEIIELALAPIGSHVRLENGNQGIVRSLSPGGTRMLVCLDSTQAEEWVHGDDPWTLCDMLLAPDASASAPTDDASGLAAKADDGDDEVLEADDADAIDSAPMIENWRWTPDGALCGNVYGKSGYRDGEQMTTSIVPPEGRFKDHIVTGSGTIYRIGMCAPTTGGMRRSSRAVGKESLLDTFADAQHAVPSAPDVYFTVGGAEVGGVAAERIMRGAFSVLDDNLVLLRAQVRAARLSPRPAPLPRHACTPPRTLLRPWRQLHVCMILI